MISHIIYFLDLSNLNDMLKAFLFSCLINSNISTFEIKHLALHSQSIQSQFLSRGWGNLRLVLNIPVFANVHLSLRQDICLSHYLLLANPQQELSKLKNVKTYQHPLLSQTPNTSRWEILRLLLRPSFFCRFAHASPLCWYS